MQYIASISYGKDSLAMLEVIAQNHLPLDRIVHVEIMATSNIPADLPDVMEWKKYADQSIFERYGIQVEHLRAHGTYEELLFGIPKRTEKNADMQGKIRGFPSLRSQWCSKELKVRVLRRLNNTQTVQYIGIAADEPRRTGQLNEHLRSPLVEFGIPEAQCMEICKKLKLLAPSYLQSKRSGCWFCHAQPIAQLRILRKQHPQLWKKLLLWDERSPIPFRHGTRHGNHTVHDFDTRFSLEDDGVIQPDDARFKWAMLNGLYSSDHGR